MALFGRFGGKVLGSKDSAERQTWSAFAHPASREYLPGIDRKGCTIPRDLQNPWPNTHPGHCMRRSRFAVAGTRICKPQADRCRDEAWIRALAGPT